MVGKFCSRKSNKIFDERHGPGTMFYSEIGIFRVILCDRNGNSVGHG
jgi:hypothetical protein